MPESSNNDPAKPENKALDLSELQNLNFGPSWSERKESLTGGSRGGRGSGDADRREGRSGGGRDRRPSRRDARGGGQGSGGQGGGERRSFGGGRSGGQRAEYPPRSQSSPESGQGESGREGGQRFRGEGRRGDRPRGGHRFERSDAPHEPPFEPVVDVLFYPEDTPFKALSHAMRSSCRTYELFEIARLILDKPDRHVIVIKPRVDGKGVTQLYQSVPDGLPFASEEEAFAHVLANHLERFFEVTQEACEPPKGNFPAISRCGITGKLLGPPNYHLYQQFLIEHHARELPRMPFERFQARIESVRDEEAIAQWQEQMSTQTRYKLKQPVEGEQEVFESLEAVRLFLRARHLNEVLRKVPQVRLSGTLVETLPQGAIRKSLLAALAHQKRFPLESANNLRGRLRRLKFTIYKRKGVSFVCAVKRNFRDENARFSESVQALVTFIEAHPNVFVNQLPQRYLGIELKKAERTALPAQEKVPNIEAVPEEEARKIVEAHELKHAASAKPASEQASTESSVSEQTIADSAGDASSSVADVASSAADVPAADAATGEQHAAAPVSAEGEAPASPQLEDPRVRQMLNDLRWLIAEGYVTEFGDGRLYASPVLKGPAPAGEGDDDDHKADADDAAGEEAPADASAKADADSATAAATAEVPPAAPPVASAEAAQADAQQAGADAPETPEAESAAATEAAADPAKPVDQKQ